MGPAACPPAAPPAPNCRLPPSQSSPPPPACRGPRHPAAHPAGARGLLVLAGRLPWDPGCVRTESVGHARGQHRLHSGLLWSFRCADLLHAGGAGRGLGAMLAGGARACGSMAARAWEPLLLALPAPPTPPLALPQLPFLSRLPLLVQSKMAQPRNFLGGQMISAVVGITVRVRVGAGACDRVPGQGAARRWQAAVGGLHIAHCMSGLGGGGLIGRRRRGAEDRSLRGGPLRGGGTRPPAPRQRL